MPKAFRIVVSAVIGLLVGLGVVGFRHRPPRWEKLLPTASPVTEIANLCVGGVYVRTADGSLFGLFGLSGKPESWLPNPGAKVQCLIGLPTERCDLSSEAFSVLTFPPTDIKRCLQSRWLSPEGYRREAYVLDSRGNLWRWLDASELDNGWYTPQRFGQFVDVLTVICFTSLSMFAWLIFGPKEAQKGGNSMLSSGSG